ncbi:MAG TPA: 16S rRNA (cytidine(1402)-2'-O)-methyltransferase [Thermoanaerobaculia bacterium]|nr:16S rRNA (cytidine(1402)-2'-O)-methyltransferase [Thermoanaerobaculia bacterium]
MTGEGKLLVIGTPIGNLDDLSARAIAAIKSCAILYCEDTRHTRKLLTHFGISVPLDSFHEHNERDKTDRIVERIRSGETVGLVSDAGMPQLSDPGHPLLRKVRELGLRVEPIPGPFAGALALVASGLPPVPFAFFGFAPHRTGERREFYHRVAAARMTSIVYESPNRVIGSLEDARAAMGDVEVTVAREMTKLHEEFLNGAISGVLETLRQRSTIPGEITLVFGAAAEAPVSLPAPEILRDELHRLRDQGMRRNDAIKVLAEKYGVSRNEVYRILVE